VKRSKKRVTASDLHPNKPEKETKQREKAELKMKEGKKKRKRFG